MQNNPTTSESVAQFLAARLEQSEKTQRTIAAEVGYGRANIITMFKQGQTRVPLHMAPKLAIAIGVDPGIFLRMCLREYMPELLEAIEETYGPLPV